MFRIFGPPGTGKTTTLLNMLDSALENGVSANTIAFLAFTRKAANEAKERASNRFHLDPEKDLFYFRTLHSLALSSSGIRTEQVMGKEHYKELSDLISIPLVSGSTLEDDILDRQANDHPILSLINLARLCKTSLREQYNKTYMVFDWNTVNYVDKCYKEYKQQHELYDFTDMLQEFVNQSGKYCPKFDLCFLDEAQDLSALQWDIAHILDDNSDRMYAAGDDDPAVLRHRLADGVQGLLLGAVDEAAGVDHDHVRILVGRHDVVAVQLELGEDALRVHQRLGAAEADHADLLGVGDICGGGVHLAARSTPMMWSTCRKWSAWPRWGRHWAILSSARRPFGRCSRSSPSCSFPLA